MLAKAHIFAALTCAIALLLAPALSAQESAPDSAAEAPAEPAPEAGAPAEGDATKPERPTNYDDPGVAGGRDVVPARPLHVVWRELVEIRNQLYEIIGDRDMRSVVLSPEEQSLIVALSKRAFDLCDEFDKLTFDRLDGDVRYYAVRTSLRFLQTELAQIRSVGAGPIHRHLPSVLTQLTIRLRGVYLSHSDHPDLLGTTGLPEKKHEDETVPLPVFKGDESAPTEVPEKTPSS